MSENSPSTQPSNRFPLFITLLVAVIALAAVFAVGLQINDDDPDPATSATAGSSTETYGIVTSGKGTVTAKPDQLVFTATVTNKRASTAAAMAATNAGVRAVTAAAKQGGVAAGDVETTALSIRPSYDYSRGAQRLVGYVSTQRVQILVRSLGNGGKVIGAVTTAGGNAVSVGSVKLTLSNSAELAAQARTKAVQQSKAAAEALATAAGRNVGDLEYVEEVVPQTYGYRDQDLSATKNLAAVVAQSSVPISAGSKDVSVTVSVRWALAGQ